MFAIGDKEWPGISKLIEECGEVSQVCGKLMGTGGLVDHWDGSNLKQRLEEELGDVLAAIWFVEHHCELDKTKLHEHAFAKLRRFISWHQNGDANQKALK